jgi:hypothetical protein
MADSTCPDVYVWCQLPAPICLNPSSLPSETSNNTEDAECTLLLSREEASVRAVHKGKTETGERHVSYS